jgi:hypothetical protein
VGGTSFIDCLKSRSKFGKGYRSRPTIITSQAQPLVRNKYFYPLSVKMLNLYQRCKRGFSEQPKHTAFPYVANEHFRAPLSIPLNSNVK